MSEITIDDKQKRLEKAKETTQYILKESSRREWRQSVETTKDVYEKFK